MRGRRPKGDPWVVARANALARGATVAFGDGRICAAQDVSARKQAGRAPSKTELRYAAEVLEPGRLDGSILRYQHQPKPPFLLAHRCTFSPDYRVELADGAVEIVDVKGMQVWEDSLVKMKFTARLHPELRCVVVQRLKGAWHRRVIPPLKEPAG